MTRKQNISQVVSQKLCNTCGACFSVCMSGAIRYRETVGGYYFPVVDKEVCINCGLCSSVCPGIHFSEGLLQGTPDDPFAGYALNAFVGKSTDKRIYENSQSGGIITALLVHALKTGLADSAVTVCMNWGNPPRPKAYLASSVDEIISGQKSKYCPVPVLSVIKEIIGSDRRIIFVGTSCQVHGLLNIMNKIPRVKNNVSLIVGLVCDRVMTYGALDYLLKESSIENENNKLIYRDKLCGGYPGNINVFTKSGKSVVLPSKKRIRIKDYFTPVRCRLCFDKMNIFSDITAGDPWGIENVDNEMGESILVSRTGLGSEVIEAAWVDTAIDIRPIQYDQVLKGQGVGFKRVQWRGYIEAWKESGGEVPNYYDQVKPHARAPVCNKKYLRDLQYSLNLDKYLSRDELIRSVRKKMKKKQLVSGLLYPARVSKLVSRKLKMLVFRR